MKACFVTQYERAKLIHDGKLAEWRKVCRKRVGSYFFIFSNFCNHAINYFYNTNLIMLRLLYVMMSARFTQKNVGDSTSEQEITEPSPALSDMIYPLDGVTRLIIPGSVREEVAEVLFEQVESHQIDLYLKMVFFKNKLEKSGNSNLFAKLKISCSFFVQ